MHPSWSDIARTTSFRLALLYAALFAVSALVLFAVIYWVATDTLADQIDSGLAEERAALAVQGSSGGVAELAEIIAERMRRPGGQFRYLLQDASGRVIAGDFPPQQISRTGYIDVEVPPSRGSDDDPNYETHIFRGLGDRLLNGDFLLIAVDAHTLDELRELIARGFAWGGGAVLLLAALGGGVMSAGVVRRVEAINRASESIMAGDLSRRLPVRAGREPHDEFDRLASNLNVMLDRIEHLVDGLRQVSADIAHDLRAPLGRLHRTLEAAREGAPATAEPNHLAAIDRAINEANTILATFGALLRIAQIEAGAARRGFGPVDLSAMLESILEVYGPAADEKRQTLTGRIPVGVLVTGDRALLTQLFANLVENAVRHSSIGAHIEVALVPPSPGQGPEVTVSDDGPGIPPDERSKVFRRFYRLDASRSTPGNGLGLALVAAIAELHVIAVRLTDHKPRGLRVCLSFAPEPVSGKNKPDAAVAATMRRAAQ
jgi:signal transduction histidine kinase